MGYNCVESQVSLPKVEQTKPVANNFPSQNKFLLKNREKLKSIIRTSIDFQKQGVFEPKKVEFKKFLEEVSDCTSINIVTSLILRHIVSTYWLPYRFNIFA